MHSVDYQARQLLGSRIRAVRQRLGLSQQAFADELKAIGLDVGEPNSCTKRLVQKWEAGEHRMPSEPYRHAIEKLTGEAFAFLCVPSPPRDVTDAARRVSRAIAALAELEAELLDLHKFLNFAPVPEMERGHDQ